MLTPGPALKYSDVGGLTNSIDSAYRLASHRLFEVFIEKFKLLDHLTALKSYLLLGRGDFADQLMEALGYVSPLPLRALPIDHFSADQVSPDQPTPSTDTT